MLLAFRPAPIDDMGSVQQNNAKVKDKDDRIQDRTGGFTVSDFDAALKQSNAQFSGLRDEY